MNPRKIKLNSVKLLLALGLTGSVFSTLANETITIGASPVPHAEMLKFIKPA